MNRLSLLLKYVFATVYCVGMLHLAHGQEYRGSSSKVSLDFGYPKLQVMDDIEFLDENNDSQLSSNEAMLISFSVKNIGEYPATNVKVRPEELNKTPGLDIPGEIDLGEIKAGESKKVEIGIEGKETLRKGTASFVFRIMENGAFQNLSVPYVVNTKQ
ncbi:MAG: hypothetical protein AAF587_31510 [Bacteroidota bacterium]